MSNTVCWGKCVNCGEPCDRQPSHHKISRDCVCATCIDSLAVRKKARR